MRCWSWNHRGCWHVKALPTVDPCLGIVVLQLFSISKWVLLTWVVLQLGRLASNPGSCSKSGAFGVRRTLADETPLHSERCEQHYLEKGSLNPTWRSGGWTEGGVERRDDRKEASAASKLHGWTERLANSHDLQKVHRRLNRVNLQVSSSRLLDHRDKPNPSNETIVLVDDDHVHTNQLQFFVLLRLREGFGNFRV